MSRDDPASNASIPHKDAQGHGIDELTAHLNAPTKVMMHVVQDAQWSGLREIHIPISFDAGSWR
jgi:hypothetical protein